jgi:hypothetical protein
MKKPLIKAGVPLFQQKHHVGTLACCSFTTCTHPLLRFNKHVTHDVTNPCLNSLIEMEDVTNHKHLEFRRS